MITEAAAPDRLLQASNLEVAVPRRAAARID